MSQSTIVFVRGAWHGPLAWDAVIRELPDLPTRSRPADVASILRTELASATA